MKRSIILKSIIFLLLTNCGGKDANTEMAQDTKDEQIDQITESKIEKLRYSDYVLSRDAEDAVTGWSEFIELSKQIEFLKKADLSFFQQEEALKVFLVELKENLPETLNSNPIKARMLVFETRLLKLNNDLTLDNIPIDEQLESIKDLLEAMSNLNFVINKKLEFERNDVGRPEQE